MKIILLMIFVLFSSNLFAQKVTLPVFQKNTIQFGDSSNQGSVIVSDKGRIISKKVILPVIEKPVQITVRMILKSAGDRWDRFGSVYLYTPTGNIELLKFMTGFGVGNKKVPERVNVGPWADEMECVNDISELYPLLKGGVVINAMIDTWVNPGWEITFEIIYTPNELAKNPDFVIPLINTTGQYPDYKVFDAGGIFDTLDITQQFSELKLYYYSSGHGGDSAGDEFNKKENIISINGSQAFTVIPWRDDCRIFRRYNPTSSKWEGDIWSSDLSRTGWCPGDMSLPFVYDVNNLFHQGQNTFNVNVINSERLSETLDYWNISAYLIGYK
ncbi:MAG TPA: peptide-N-glycosidase F-related protein [Ignavibacteria bacterium]|nr:peptide-N-glycosidase F-related protein [Ignavibacteria bacterium]